MLFQKRNQGSTILSILSVSAFIFGLKSNAFADWSSNLEVPNTLATKVVESGARSFNRFEVRDDTGGVIIAWYQVGGKLFVQRIDSSGNQLWGKKGKLAGTGRLVGAVSDQEGGIVIIYLKETD